MKTGCTSGKKNFVFTFHSVCTVFEIHSKNRRHLDNKKNPFFIVLGLHCF